ncbi:hypothetical protein FSO04_35810 [Paraburkholderia madseniana]|uniref:Uncharacterized protein n=1 Tax=Paraburkholderia madseniana TaxID=2599607 RepID=A0A6N6W450_9BURK|nr:hypothetical protein [Paraburkholderia madseniana]KAE8755176.1 hypothetical protein FSO04_35810 [Paraburkholderia madseniana]
MNGPDIRTFPAGAPFDRLATALLALLDSARPADQQGDRLADWKSARGECHDNADSWVALYPERRAVRGWRHEDFNGVTHKLVAHSVIRTGAGLVDVTLPSTEPVRPFIEHPRAVCGFFAVLCRKALTIPPTKSGSNSPPSPTRSRRIGIAHRTSPSTETAGERARPALARTRDGYPAALHNLVVPRERASADGRRADR